MTGEQYVILAYSMAMVLFLGYGVSIWVRSCRIAPNTHNEKRSISDDDSTFRERVST